MNGDEASSNKKPDPVGLRTMRWIATSGLIVFAANLLYTDFIKQPDLRLTVNDLSKNDNNTNYRELNKIALEVIFNNNGIVSAKDVALSIFTFHDLKIEEHIISYHDEELNNTKEYLENNGTKLVVKANRLAPYNDLDLGLTLNFSDMSLLKSQDKDMVISTSYEQGARSWAYDITDNNVIHIGHQNPTFSFFGGTKDLIFWLIIGLLIVIVVSLLPDIYTRIMSFWKIQPNNK